LTDSNLPPSAALYSSTQNQSGKFKSFGYGLEPMKKLKIVHIVEALGGGVYTYFTDLTHVSGDLPNVETTIIYSDKRTQIDPGHVAEDFHKDMRLIKIAMVRNISLKQDYLTYKQLKSLIKDLEPDIIHLHSSKASILGRLAHFFSKSNALLYYTPHAYAFLRHDISMPKRKFYFVIEKLVQKLFGGKTIACGDTEYDYARKIGSAGLIRNGIDIKYVEDHKEKVKNDILTVGTLGRITHNKNPFLFNELALRHPDIKFLWIGDGELRHLLTAPNIEVTGWFKVREVGIYKLNEVDIYLQTSVLEGLPMALLEAMVLEKPIIATNVIGNKDVVDHKKTGFLFDSKEEFDNYLEILKVEAKRKEFGKNGHTRCYSLFNSEKNFKQLIDLYWSDYLKKKNLETAN
tara:strand:- start:1578 stop:2786 length:1209 start_codon:yes stop_codon:yes gene_type:complete